MIQVIKRKCCQTIFAGCREPECYTDKDWQKDVRKYSLEGCKIEMIEKGTFSFGKCECKKAEPKDLFN